MIVQHNMENGLDCPQDSGLFQWFASLQSELAQASQRALLVVRGERSWVLSVVAMLDPTVQRVVLSNQQDIDGAVPFTRAETLLGGESDQVIYDQFSGLNIDVLCMGAGLVRAGGLLIVLAPQQRQADPYGQWQGVDGRHAYFNDYLQRWYDCDHGVVQLEQHAAVPAIVVPRPASPTRMVDGLSEDQHRTLTAMQHWYQGSRPLCLLIADRGRGKSTLLGHFVTALAETSVSVIAPSRKHARVLLRVSAVAGRAIEFMAPDEFIRRQQHVPCLVIDEAAMLPNRVLQRCLALADRVVMATTTGGYEGTGQGFLLKFVARLASQSFQQLTLQQPVRWAAGDRLEHLLDDMLLLNPGPELPVGQGGAVRYEVLDQEQLNRDEALLQSAYRLLVFAHYRTRPSDLRQLMENENQRLVVARRGQAVVGVVQLNREGGLAEKLCEEIFMGRRRPQGHLLAQMITAQAGIPDFATYRGLRVQRIAVHPALRRQGIGCQLLQHAWLAVQQEQLDYLASSFAFDAETALFWKQVQFDLVHIAAGRGKSSGQQTIAVIRVCNPALTETVQRLQQRIQSALPVWLLTYCNQLAWQEVRVLPAMLPPAPALSFDERHEIVAFADGYRGFDYSQFALQRLLLIGFFAVPPLSDFEQQLMIEKILLNYHWDSMSRWHRLSGKKALLSCLRQAVKTLYDHVDRQQAN